MFWYKNGFSPFLKQQKISFCTFKNVKKCVFNFYTFENVKKCIFCVLRKWIFFGILTHCERLCPHKPCLGIPHTIYHEYAWGQACPFSIVVHVFPLKLGLMWYYSLWRFQCHQHRKCASKQRLSVYFGNDFPFLICCPRL